MQEHSYRLPAIGSREMLDIREAEYGGEMLYINKSKHHPMWAMEYCRDEGLRKYWDEYSYPYHKNGEGNNSFRSAMTNKVQKMVDARAYNHNQDSNLPGTNATSLKVYKK